jgi:hypothetical protein
MDGLHLAGGGATAATTAAAASGLPSLRSVGNPPLSLQLLADGAKLQAPMASAVRKAQAKKEAHLFVVCDEGQLPTDSQVAYPEATSMCM